MIVNVQVNAGPFSHQGANTAYHFIRAALERGHTVQRVFFYADGVYNGNDLTVPPQDERHRVSQWSALAEQSGIDLVICVAAAQRRGILDSGEARRHGKLCANLAPGFRLSGLGQLVEAAIDADRLVVFNR